MQPGRADRTGTESRIEGEQILLGVGFRGFGFKTLSPKPKGLGIRVSGFRIPGVRHCMGLEGFRV